jgi:hypothetical protein
VSRTDWDALLSGFGVNAALVTFPEHSPRPSFFDPERWALVYRAADALVFVRRRPEVAPLVARTELPIEFVVDRAAGVIQARPVLARPAGSPVRDCEWRRRLGDFFTEAGDDASALAAYQAARAAPGCLDGAAAQAAGMALGDVALRLHDPAVAVDAYVGIDRPRAHINRALALLALGRAREALDEARGVLARDPADADARNVERLARERLPAGVP